jgi:hypothetical protein
LYFGDQPATCLLEILVHAFELPSTYELVAVDVSLARIVDLASTAGRSAARVSIENLVACPRPVTDERGSIAGTRHGVTWELGRLAWTRGADGLFVPSAALAAQRVLVVFGRSGEHLEIRDRRPCPPIQGCAGCSAPRSDS